MNWDKVKITKLEGVQRFDSPDFVDAFAASAIWGDGTPLTQPELDRLNDEHYGLVCDTLWTGLVHNVLG